MKMSVISAVFLADQVGERHFCSFFTFVQIESGVEQIEKSFDQTIC